MNLLAVNFHYFRETTYASGIYPTSRKALEKQIDAIHRRYKFVSQEDLDNCFRNQVFPKGEYCVLTFDDGLKEQMNAFDYLSEKGIPAIFYVATDPIRQAKVLPTHQLQQVRTQLDDAAIFEYLQKNTNISSYPFKEQLLENQYRYDDPLARRVKYFLNFILSESEKQTLVQQLFCMLHSDEAAFSKAFYMNEDELRRLAIAGVLGSHGSAHLALATVSEAMAEQDIKKSIDYLETLDSKPISSFSYPFGGAAAVSPVLATILDKAGIQFAFTMKRGINTSEQLQDRFFLQRVDTNDAPGGKNPLPELC
jgi:peptidoglycan/xylan/chitin deacetylase (PgdA/CDA1 family)